MTNERIILSSNHWDFPNFDGSCGMWSAHGPWLCLKCDIYIYIYIYIMIYYDLFLNGQAILRYTYQDTASYKIPGPAHRGPQFLAQIACKGGREGAPPNLRFAACKWALIQWIGLRNILQKTHRIYQSGVSCPVDFTLNRFWDLQMEKWGTHTAKCQCWEYDDKLLELGSPIFRQT